MAVYTHIPMEEMAALVARFGVGTLCSAKGIAEGVENSNYLVETEQGRFILTVYEKRVDAGDLPFFMGLLDHLAEKGCPVPRTMHLAEGGSIADWNGKKIALIEFLPGVTVDKPTPAQAQATGAALGDLHRAVADFPGHRPNTLGLDGWVDLARQCGSALDDIHPGLAARVAEECAFLQAHWPHHLAKSVVHADLFPDNVLMLDNKVTGLIDFYFACEDVRAWDVAVTHSAWSFNADGTVYDAAVGDALLAGYQGSFGLSAEEAAAFPVLARGSCLRFLLTRAYDWIHTPADALVTRKDPIAYLNRLEHYAAL